MEFERIADQKRTDFITSSVTQSIDPGAFILDVGCGNGLISRAFGEKGYEVLGIDVSEKTIAVARQNNHLSNVQFRVIPAGELVPEPGKYDAIICSEVLEHLNEPQLLLNTLYQSLKNNGVLIVTVPNGFGPRELLVTKPVQSLQNNNGFTLKMLSKIKISMGYTGTTVQSSADDLRHIQFFTKKSLMKLASASGFRIEKIAATNFIEQVFPFSLLTKKSRALQRADCKLADLLPIAFTSGFMSIWKKT
ncbi:MAG: methyltransferase domain-containing protein [Flavitalea sp.]